MASINTANLSQLPPPSCQVLQLVSALSQTANHEIHVQAIQARDQALSISADSYSHLCYQLALVLVAADDANVARLDPAELHAWKQSDPATVARLEASAAEWVPFGQMAGLVLKRALTSPPIMQNDGLRLMSLQPPYVQQVQEILQLALQCQHVPLRNVVSSIIATTSVSPDGVQPYLSLKAWPSLLPTLQQYLQEATSVAAVQGSLATINKMLEDGPHEFDHEDLDSLIPLLFKYVSINTTMTGVDNPSVLEMQINAQLQALQAVVSCLAAGLLPSALVAHFSEYLQALSSLATHNNSMIREWVCRSLNIVLQFHSELLQPHFESICQFMLAGSAGSMNDADNNVALQACEFWLTLATLDPAEYDQQMAQLLQQKYLAPLVPILVGNMVYTTDQRVEILEQNASNLQEGLAGVDSSEALRPVFHKNRNKHGGSSTNNAATPKDDDTADIDDASNESVDVSDDGDEWDDGEDGNEWTLRRCSAAALDSLATLYGHAAILPPLVPVLEQGLGSSDAWVQEACILALGAVAEGCADGLVGHLNQLFPYLINQLQQPESKNVQDTSPMPQIKGIAAWTIGRYADWAIQQVQCGAQGYLLAQLTETFLARIYHDVNRRVQIACCAAFGVLIETAGDLMAPYLENTYRTIAYVLPRYNGRSLMLLFDLLGILADFCGSAISENDMLSLYVPTLLQMWKTRANMNIGDKILLPLMESLASICVAAESDMQPYAAECFEASMATIESTQLQLATTSEGNPGIMMNEEEADPIVCALDVLDGLVEGLKDGFAPIVSGSQRYGQHFLSVLLASCQHDIPGVRMSAFALFGDLVHSAPMVVQPALNELLQAAVENMDPIQPAVCANAVWTLGEVCVRTEGNPAMLQPYAATILQNLIALLVGNGNEHTGRDVDIPGLSENAAACVGRLAKVDPGLVASELPRFLLGWCDGMAKVSEPVERRDAFQGFLKAVYANPEAIKQSSANIPECIASIIFAILTWHMPEEMQENPSVMLLSSSDQKFRPFPPAEAELGHALKQFVKDMKTSVGDDAWYSVQKELPVNVRKLLREAYET